MPSKTQNDALGRAALPRSAYARLEALQDRPDDLFIERTIEQTPAVLRARRATLKLTRRLKLAVPDGRLFVEYSDRRSELEAIRVRHHFDAGYLRGRLEGRAQARCQIHAARMLVERLTEVVLEANLPTTATLTALLATADAMATRLPRRPSSKRLVSDDTPARQIGRRRRQGSSFRPEP